MVEFVGRHLQVVKMIGNETSIFQDEPQIKRQSVMEKTQSLRRSGSRLISKEKSNLSVHQAIPRPVLEIPTQTILIQSVTSPSDPSQLTSVNDSLVNFIFMVPCIVTLY